MHSRSSTVVAIGVSAALSLSACGSDATTAAGAATPTTAAADAAAGVPAGSTVTIIDVRSAEEFAAGHLQGALNLNVEDGTLEAALPTLDPAGSYIVYCRSGRRSAIAVALMQANGFTTIEDLGALDQAASVTGLPVLTG